MNLYSEENNRLSLYRTQNIIRSMTAEDLSPFEEKYNQQKNAFIAELEISGILSFSEKTRFEFGKLNILIGPNGSGKSNLIDCLRLLKDLPQDLQDTFKDSGFEDWLYKGKDFVKDNAFIEVTLTVPNVHHKIKHQLKLTSSIQSKVRVEEVILDAEESNESTATYFVGSYRSPATINMKVTESNRKNRKLGENYDSFQSILSQVRDIEQYPEITQLSKTYSGFRIYSEWSFGRNSNLRESAPATRSDTILSESMNDLALILNGFENTPSHSTIRSLLRELKDSYRDYATRIMFGRVGLELIEFSSDFPIPAKRLSDGTLRFLAIAAILTQDKLPPLICLEEPELGMHPDMTRIVAQMIVEASRKTQIIITTHSENLLTALQDDFDALFTFESENVGTFVRKFSKEQYFKWRESHNLGDLWTSGEIGGNRW